MAPFTQVEGISTSISTVNQPDEVKSKSDKITSETTGREDYACTCSTGAERSPIPTMVTIAAENAFLDSETAAATQAAKQLIELSIKLIIGKMMPKILIP